MTDPEEYDSIQFLGNAVDVLKEIQTIEEFNERYMEFVDLMEKSMLAGIEELKEILALPEEERQEKLYGVKEGASKREEYEAQIDTEMQRLGELPGGEEALDKAAEAFAERIEPHAEELMELMMKFMGGMMGDTMGALMGGMGEMMGEMMGGEEVPEPVYSCGDCGAIKLKGDPCVICNSVKEIIKCNLCLGEMPDDSLPRCPECQAGAQSCPHCKADLPPGELPEDCPHCGVPPKEQKTCKDCETTHYRDGDLCEDCQYEADKPRCKECGEEMYEGDKYCSECYEEDHEGKLIKRIKCPACGEKMPETEEECFACGAKMKA